MVRATCACLSSFLAAAVPPQLVPRLPRFPVFAVFVRFFHQLTPDAASSVETWRRGNLAASEKCPETTNAREFQEETPPRVCAQFSSFLAYVGFRDVPCMMYGMGPPAREGGLKKFTFLPF